MNINVKPDQKSREIHDLAARFRASNPRIVNADRRSTDVVELLVDASPDATLFDLGGLQEALQELLGTRVDLLTPGDLPADFRLRVLSSARPI